MKDSFHVNQNSLSLHIKASELSTDPIAGIHHFELKVIRTFTVPKRECVQSLIGFSRASYDRKIVLLRPPAIREKLLGPDIAQACFLVPSEKIFTSLPTCLIQTDPRVKTPGFCRDINEGLVMDAYGFRRYSRSSDGLIQCVFFIGQRMRKGWAGEKCPNPNQDHQKN